MLKRFGLSLSPSTRNIIFHSLYHCAGKVDILRDKHKEITDTSQLGSTIMETMLKEVSEFCNPVKRNNWSNSTRQQVHIYT